MDEPPTWRKSIDRFQVAVWCTQINRPVIRDLERIDESPERAAKPRRWIKARRRFLDDIDTVTAIAAAGVEITGELAWKDANGAAIGHRSENLRVTDSLVHGLLLWLTSYHLWVDCGMAAAATVSKFRFETLSLFVWVQFGSFGKCNRVFVPGIADPAHPTGDS
jgi:hypothetical protein